MTFWLGFFHSRQKYPLRIGNKEQSDNLNLDEIAKCNVLDEEKNIFQFTNFWIGISDGLQ